MSRATIVAVRSPGVAVTGTFTVNGTSARVRAGTRIPVSANVTGTPVARSRTVTGRVVGLVTDTASWRVAPGSPSA